MKKTKTLSSLRVDEKTIDNMKSAINKYNENNLLSISENEFRRLAYEYLSQHILKDIPLKI